MSCHLTTFYISFHVTSKENVSHHLFVKLSYVMSFLVCAVLVPASGFFLQ